VIANALYDPRKVYTFLVYGNFDVNGDGRATAAEADQIRALIEGWGGKVVSDLSGNVDFLVLGQRPQVPPKPGAGQPIAVVQEFIRLDQAAQRYDTLFQQASATSIPVLNENRLYTLIGKVR
jgi:redox-sensitive bicupin YhaK (pirin superfamily)